MANVDSIQTSPFPTIPMSEVQTVTLFKERVEHYMNASMLSARDYDVRVYFDHLAQTLVAQVKTMMARGYQPEEKRTVRIPLSAWQHFKQDYMPRWFLRRFPVKYETKEFQVKGPMFVCPHLGMDVCRDREPHIRFAMMTNNPAYTRGL